MTVKRLAGVTIPVKVTLNKPGGSEAYNLDEAENYLLYAFVEGRVIAKFSREALDGHEPVDETDVDPTQGETMITISGSKTKDLSDQLIYLLPYIQFDNLGDPLVIGAENGQRIELVHIIGSPITTVPTV